MAAECLLALLGHGYGEDTDLGDKAMTAAIMIARALRALAGGAGG